MKFFLIVIGYIIPAIISTLIICKVEKINLIDKVKNIFTNFDKKNSGPVYNFLKTVVSLIIFLACIIMFFGFIGIVLLGGPIFEEFIMNGNYISAIVIIILNTIGDFFIFSLDTD